MARPYAARYLAKAVAGAPRDFVNAWLAGLFAVHPTVLVYNCTFVCDASCQMCGNWRRGNAASDMALNEIERVFDSPFWRRIENAHISGGEPTTRDDLVEIARLMLGRFPKLRKLGLSTTGLTPERAVPALTRIVEACDERQVICSVRISIDGVAGMHDTIRQVPGGFAAAGETVAAMQALLPRYRFNLGIATTLFPGNLDEAERVRSWARRNGLNVVFNMVRFTDPMLGNRHLAARYRPLGADEARMRQFFLDNVRSDSLLDGQSYIYMHYADMIANGYRRLAPCPFQTQGVMLNPDGGLFYCENSDMIGNVRDKDPGDLYFAASSREHRSRIRQQRCRNCVSPCQINVAAIKQVTPYLRFLVRASNEKLRLRRASR